MYKKLLLPVDINSESEGSAALKAAVDLCRMTGASLTLLTVVPDFGSALVSQYFPPGFKEDSAKRALEALHDFSAKHVPDGIQTAHVIGEGSVYDVVIRIADEIEADLIVMGTGEHDLETYLLGPNADRVVRHSNRSVLVVRP